MVIQMNKLKYLFLASLAFVVLGVTSCDDDDDDKKEKSFSIEVMESSEFGTILVNQNGQAMYFFAGDVAGTRGCNGGCLDVWPPVTIDDENPLIISADLTATYFAIMNNTDGTMQVTFKGWPLYYFAQDGELEATGEVNGDGRGNKFFVAKPDYSLFFGSQVVVEGESAVLYITDMYGLTSYTKTNDGENESTCTGGCLDNWPVFEAPASLDDLMLPSIVSKSDFAIVEREDASNQLSYQGSPLYYFLNDGTTPGLVSGHGAGPFVVAEVTIDE